MHAHVICTADKKSICLFWLASKAAIGAIFSGDDLPRTICVKQYFSDFMCPPPLGIGVARSLVSRARASPLYLLSKNPILKGLELSSFRLISFRYASLSVQRCGIPL